MGIHCQRICQSKFETQLENVSYKIILHPSQSIVIIWGKYYSLWHRRIRASRLLKISGHYYVLFDQIFVCSFRIDQMTLKSALITYQSVKKTKRFPKFELKLPEVRWMDRSRQSWANRQTRSIPPAPICRKSLQPKR